MNKGYLPLSYLLTTHAEDSRQTEIKVGFSFHESDFESDFDTDFESDYESEFLSPT